MLTSRILAVLFFVVIVSSAGCGSGNQIAIIPVEGTVQFADGKPLPKGTRLIFNPAAGNTGSAMAVLEESGAFQVVHQSGKKGAGIGKYTIQVTAPEGQGAEFYKIVPRKYFDDGGILTANVTEGMGSLKLVVMK